MFFGGKGGVGKTTMAAAHALSLARRGHRTLLASTDPAHSVGDVLGQGLDDEPSQIDDRLWALEVDAAAYAARHVERIKADARETVSPEVLPAVERHLELARTSPGTMESALLDRVVDLFGTCPESYDRVVFDTAPTGHTLRLLALPELVGGLVEGLVRQRQKVAGMDRFVGNLMGSDAPAEDALLLRLRQRRDRLHSAGVRLRDDAVFWLVVVPERLPIQETARTVDALTAEQLVIGGVIVNRVLPEAGDPAAEVGPHAASAAAAYLGARRRQQDVHLADIDRRFGHFARVRVRQAPHDLVGLEDLGSLTSALGRLHPPM